MARSKSELSLTAAFPSHSFFQTALNFPQTMNRSRRQRVPHQSEGRLFTNYRRGLKEVRSDYNNSHYRSQKSNYRENNNIIESRVFEFRAVTSFVVLYQTSMTVVAKLDRRFAAAGTAAQGS